MDASSSAKLKELRVKMDKADEALLNAFIDRMNISGEVAECKIKEGIPVFDPTRERDKLITLASAAPDEMKTYVKMLYNTLFEMSRSNQNRIMGVRSELCDEIEAALENTPKLFPEGGRIACQGVEGAYSQLACEKLFGMPEIMFFKTFENVCSAIDNGLCDYGVLPLENSMAGTVNRIYDLMAKYNLRIVRSTKLKVDHSLLAKPGTKIGDIKEIYSHEQAIQQCSEFLKKHSDIKVTYFENTAAAAQAVANSDRTDLASISSKNCAALYSLSCLAESVQDRDNNYTRFVCLAKQAEIYPGADRTSIIMVLPHKPGSLYRAMSKIHSMGVNIQKLESRPIAERDFDFMFYFDLDVSVYSENFLMLIQQLEEAADTFIYLGSYREV